jgi:hypothetical protein
MVSIPSCSHNGDPRLIQLRYVVSHEFEDFRGVGAAETRALEINLAAKLVGQRPSHSIDDEAALDPKDDMPEEGHSARRTDVAPYKSSGRRIGLEKSRERSAALS